MSHDTTAFAFTFDRYRALLTTLRDANARFRTFEAVASESDAGDAQSTRPTVCLRHDVDWSPRKARRLAAIESELDVTATYFFLVSATAYNPLDRETRAALADIAARGHTVGVHVDLRDVGDAVETETVAARIQRARRVLTAAGVEPAAAVSFHNPPDWIIGRPLDIEGVVNTYAPRFVEQYVYAADSNQRWRSDPPLQGGVPDRLQLLTHPVLWGERDAWTVDRLREERDYHTERLSRSLARTDRTWSGPRGLGDAFDVDSNPDFDDGADFDFDDGADFDPDDGADFCSDSDD